MSALTSLEQKLGLPKVLQELLTPVRPRIDGVDIIVDDGRTAPISCNIPTSTNDSR